MDERWLWVLVVYLCLFALPLLFAVVATGWPLIPPPPPAPRREGERWWGRFA